MDQAEVDPRYVTGLIRQPAYRVDFWGRVGGSEIAGRSCASWRLTGASGFEEVAAWARDESNGRTVVIYAEYEDGTDFGLVRLSGQEPED